MKIFDLITAIISKGYDKLDNQDKRQLIELQDQLYQERALRTETILVTEQKMKSDEAIRTLELKEEKTDDWKKKYTESQIESIINQELQEFKTRINVAKFEKDKIEGKIDALDKYITALRDKLNTARV